jgi:hypothetical protein
VSYGIRRLHGSRQKANPSWSRVGTFSAQDKHRLDKLATRISMVDPPLGRGVLAVGYPIAFDKASGIPMDGTF